MSKVTSTTCLCSQRFIVCKHSTRAWFQWSFIRRHIPKRLYFWNSEKIERGVCCKHHCVFSDSQTIWQSTFIDVLHIVCRVLLFSFPHPHPHLLREKSFREKSCLLAYNPMLAKHAASRWISRHRRTTTAKTPKFWSLERSPSLNRHVLYMISDHND